MDWSRIPSFIPKPVSYSPTADPIKSSTLLIFSSVSKSTEEWMARKDLKLHPFLPADPVCLHGKPDRLLHGQYLVPASMLDE